MTHAVLVRSGSTGSLPTCAVPVGSSLLSSSPPVVSPVPGLSMPTILVFDSGLGGMSVLRELVRARPDARYVYAADDAGFPYGAWDEPALIDRIVAVMDQLIAQVTPDAVVIACSTASTLVLPALRARFSMPFVGTVPAVKPACEGSASKRISVLATPGTVKRDYTQSLIREFAASCRVTLVGAPRLAPLAEAALAGENVADAEFAAELAPAFVAADDGRTDTVVLACTHYPLVRDRLERVAPWPVRWIDPAPAIARRTVSLVGAPMSGRTSVPLRLISTGRPLDSGLIARISGLPVASAEVQPIEVSIA